MASGRVLHGEWNDVIQQLVAQPDYSIGRVAERLNTKREVRDNQREKHMPILGQVVQPELVLLRDLFASFFHAMLDWQLIMTRRQLLQMLPLKLLL